MYSLSTTGNCLTMKSALNMVYDGITTLILVVSALISFQIESENYIVQKCDNSNEKK
jgi:hypothetical protein